INGRIRYFAQNVMFNKSVFAILWKNAINTGVDYPIIADYEVVACLAHYAIAFVVDYFKILDKNSIARIKEGIVYLLFAVQGGPFPINYHSLQAYIVLVNVYVL